MTGYYIEIGYNPCNADADENWLTLATEARRVADNPEAIAAEVRRLDGPEECEDGCCHLDEYVKNYAEPFSGFGHPVKVNECKRYVSQQASTDRGFKYHVRRAYVRLVIEAMHRHGIEVNLTVA